MLPVTQLIACQSSLLDHIAAYFSLYLSLFYGLSPFLSSIFPKIVPENLNKIYVIGNIFTCFSVRNMVYCTRNTDSGGKQHEKKDHDLRHRPRSRRIHRHGHARLPEGSPCKGSHPAEGPAGDRCPRVYAQRFRPEPGGRPQRHAGRRASRDIQPVLQPDL